MRTHIHIMVLLYTALDASKREIRLLRVLPTPSDGSTGATRDDDDQNIIHCELGVHQLNHDRGTTPYTALSYVWGPEPCEPSTTTAAGEEKRLSVNNEVIRARESLFSALQAFRRGRQGGGYIWVDAVCINQGDHEEKKTQIPLMGDIYGLAAQTLIWLGAAEGDSDLAMDTLDALDPNDFEGVCFSEEQGRRWRAVMSLLQRSWCKCLSRPVRLLTLSPKITARSISQWTKSPTRQGRGHGSHKKPSYHRNQSHGVATSQSPSSAS